MLCGVLVDEVGWLWGMGWEGLDLLTFFCPVLSRPTLSRAPGSRCLVGPVAPGSKPDRLLGGLDIEPRP